MTRGEGRQHVQQIDSGEAEEIPSSSTAIVSRNSLRQRAGKGGGKGRAAIVAERVNHEPEPLVVINRWEPADHLRGERGPAFITTHYYVWTIGSEVSSIGGITLVPKLFRDSEDGITSVWYWSRRSGSL